MVCFARYETHNQTTYGIVEDDVVTEINGSPMGDYNVTSHSHNISDVKLLSPIVPNKIVAIGLNYRSHLGDSTPPAVPEPFYKTPTSVIGPGEAIVIPSSAIDQGVTIQPEAELSLIIGKKCKKVSQADALSYVLGYTCGNDVSARNWQKNDLQWWRAKSCDTFAPLGPYIVTDLDPSNLRLTCRINGKVVQEQYTSDLLHGVPRIIEFVSSVVTLEPGDVIMTGTPGKPGDIHDGDTVEVELEGVGVLRNPVQAES